MFPYHEQKSILFFTVFLKREELHDSYMTIIHFILNLDIVYFGFMEQVML